MRKLGRKFSMFVSTFHSIILKNPNWRNPSLNSFLESLIQEQDKLIQMGVIRASTNQALLVGETNNAEARRKQKGKDKRNIKFKRLKKILIQKMNPHALRSTNIRVLIRESAPIVRKETIQRKVV